MLFLFSCAPSCAGGHLYFSFSIPASLTCLFCLHPTCSSACLIISLHISKNVASGMGWKWPETLLIAPVLHCFQAANSSSFSLLRDKKRHFLPSRAPFSPPPSTQFAFKSSSLPCLQKCWKKWSKQFNYWPKSLKQWKGRCQKCLFESGGRRKRRCGLRLELLLCCCYHCSWCLSAEARRRSCKGSGHRHSPWTFSVIVDRDKLNLLL